MTTESMKPYPAYKDSGIEWIGEIPEGWDTIQIKRLSQIKRGASPRPIEDQKYFDDDGDFAWVRIADVSASDKYLENTTQTLSELGASLSVKRYPGDMFLSIAGTVGKPIITKIKCCIHDGFVWFPNLKIKPEFLYYIFLAGEAYKGLGKMGTQLNLNTETVGSIPIPLPPSEQDISKIIDYLENQTAKIDTLIENKQKQIELLKEERTAIINQAVTKGLNLDVTMRDSGIEWLGEVPEHWEIVHVKHLAKNESDVVQTGPFGAQLHSSDYIDEGIPLILIRNVNNLWIDDSDIPKVSEDDAKRLQIYRLKVGDIVFSRVGSLGRVALIEEREEGWMISGQMLRIRFNNPNIHELFALYVFSSDVVVEFVKFKSVGSTRDSINTDILRNVPMTLPPLNEQYEIASYIKDESLKIDNTISQIQQQITLLQEYRTALISEAVTGKIDLRNQHEIPTPK